MECRVLYNSIYRITTEYGNGHNGVDLGWKSNEEYNIVKAHSDGQVIKIVDGKDRNRGSSGMESYGNYILIQHSDGYQTRYAHLKKHTFTVKEGDIVYKDMPIATMGESGNTYGRHLHFEVIKDNVRINPTQYLNKDLPHTTNNSSKDYINYQTHSKANGWTNNISSSDADCFSGVLGYPIDAIFVDKLKLRAHDKIKNIWLPWVYDRNDYAGNIGNPIDGLQIYNAIYRVHLKNGVWLPWVYKVDNTPEGYAGIYGKEIDAVQIKVN